MAERIMIRALSLVAWSVMVVLLISTPAHARHHKKKKPTPTPTPVAKISNSVESPDPPQGGMGGLTQSATPTPHG
jgi:hypothetical protein